MFKGINLRRCLQFVSASLLIYCVLFNCLTNVQACGPSYLEPIFDYSNAPENPWTDFASGKLGIIKSSHRRVVLTAAYRYLKGGFFSQDEQKALTEIWDADFNNKDFEGNDVTDAVKAWLKERASHLKKEEKLPAIYVEREYTGGYDYFPNCTKNAFEVAKETLSDRSGNEEKDVQEWIQGQDAVFSNCLSGAEMPKPLNETAPKWLQKDREYQIAAAQFYAMKYAEAREGFDKISQDTESPWKEVSDYLVGRTLIRQASVGNEETTTDADVARNKQKTNALLAEAEVRLNQVLSRTSKYAESSQKMINLIKYRIHPEERIRELAQNLTFQGNPDSFRQDVVDYNWLLTKLEAVKPIEPLAASVSPSEMQANILNAFAALGFNNVTVEVSSDLSVLLKGNVPRGTLAIAITEVYKFRGIPKVVNELTESNLEPDRTKLSIDETDRAEQNRLKNLPSYLKDDEISDWILTYQSADPYAYTHAVERWRATSADIWLMTALSKAAASSDGIKRLLKDSELASTSSVAYPTIVYHVARILIQQNKRPEARKLIDSILNSTIELPISTRNLFAEQRMKVSETLAEFLQHSLRKPFAFGYDGETSETALTIDEMIQQRKSVWNAADFPDQTKSDFDAIIEKEFVSEAPWQNRLFLDERTVQIFNEHFSTNVLLDVLKDPDFPDYWKHRLTSVMWTRAYLLKDEKTALAFIPEMIKLYPNFDKLFLSYASAKTSAERELNGLNVILKVRSLTPYLESGFDKEDIDDFDTWEDERWWCEQYDGTYSGDSDEKIETFKPDFLTKLQIDTAKIEHEKLKKTLDAASYLTKRVFDWSRTSPLDKRLPEALYLIYKVNQWHKYGCGDYSEESKNKAAKILRTRYPKSKWTQKMIEDETANPS